MRERTKTPLGLLYEASDAQARQRRSALIDELRRLQLRHGSARLGRGSGDAGHDGAELCSLCGVCVTPRSRHLIHLGGEILSCVCQGCWSARGVEGDERSSGRRTLWLQDFKLTNETWQALGIPIGLAFFFYSARQERTVACCPSSLGALECDLDLEAWSEVVADNPMVSDLTPDREALLVNRMARPHQSAIVPIDACHRLVGLVRQSWQGIQGGPAVVEMVVGFFEGLQHRGVRQ